MTISIIAFSVCLIILFFAFFFAKQAARIAIVEILPDVVEETVEDIYGPFDMAGILVSLVKVLVEIYFLVSIVCVLAVGGFVLAHIAGFQLPI